MGDIGDQYFQLLLQILYKLARSPALPPAVLSHPLMNPADPNAPATQRLTTAHGIPVSDNQNSSTAGRFGPVLLTDFHLVEKLARFNRERIPERVVHAKGAGAYGYLEITKDICDLTKAAPFQEV